MNGREAALKALHRIDVADAVSDVALSRALEKKTLDDRERRFCTEPLYGVLRRRNTLDWMIERCINRPISRVEPWIRNILRIGAYQIAYLDKVPQWAAVDESVKLAKKYGHGGTASLVNAGLREICRRGVPFSLEGIEEVSRLALEHSHPEWLVTRWLGRFGFEEAVSLMRANNVMPPLTVRLNPSMADSELALSEFVDKGAKVEKAKYCEGVFLVNGSLPVREIDSFRSGLFSVQDEASVIAGLVVDPQPGEFIIDACSAPGGKAIHLAQLSGDAAKILAIDKSQSRLEEVSKAAARFGQKSIAPVCGDARTISKKYKGEADRVLVDAPCSGLGTIRRNPDVKWRRAPEDIQTLAELQRDILEGASACVKPGGVLVYCTCTMEPEENLGVVTSFLKDHPEFEIDDLRVVLPLGLRSEATASKGYIQLQVHIHGTDGFFISKMRRGGSIAN